MKMKIVVTWKKLAGLVVLGMGTALLVGWSGFVSISAASGHWTLTRWFLGWTMKNAVETQAMLITKPQSVDLDDPALILRSAGHYATGCAACHGAPGVPQSPVVEEMVPGPPRLEGKIGEWSDEELFWIVKNGIKYSGMPAWPAQDRDDEVWAQVAFLRALPGMTRSEYADLALNGGLATNDLEPGGEAVASLDGIVEDALADCARCHGREGQGRGSDMAEAAVPAIAGQPVPYLYATLRAFAEGRRDSGFMEPPARRYPPDVLEALARYFSAQSAPADPADSAAPRLIEPTDDPRTAGVRAVAGAAPPTSWQDEAGVLEGESDLGYAVVPPAASSGPPSTEAGLLELGGRIAVEGIGTRKIPACQSCHGKAGRKRNSFYPYLQDQPEWYLTQQLKLWQEGSRGGTPYAHVMDEIARNLTDEQIEAVSAWYAQASNAR